MSLVVDTKGGDTNAKNSENLELIPEHSPDTYMRYKMEELREFTTFAEYILYGDDVMDFSDEILGRLPVVMLMRLGCK